MQEQSRLIPLPEKLQNRPAELKIQIKRPVDKLEPPQTPIEQPLHRGQQLFQRHVPNGHIERRQAKFAGERTSARRLHVDHAMRQIAIIIKIVRQGDPRKVRQLRRRDPHERPPSGENLFAQFAKCQIGFAGDDIIPQLANRLLIGFVAHLWAAQNHNEFRPHPLQLGHNLLGRHDVPDINPEPHNARILSEDRLDDIRRLLIDLKFQNLGRLAKGSEVCEQVPQSERGVRRILR